MADAAPSIRDPRLLAGLALAVLATASAALFVRLAEPIAPELIAAGRVGVTAVATCTLAFASLPATLARLRERPHEATWLAIAGLCLAAHFGAWIVSLSLTSVVRSVALVTTTPLFAGVLARLLGDRVSPRLYLGSVVALGGTGIMVASPDALEGGSWIGDLLALSGAITAAVYLAIGRHVHARMGDALPLRDYFALVNVVAALGLWAWVGLAGIAIAVPQASELDIAAVVFLGLVPGVIGHGLLNWAVRRTPVHVVALASLLEPLGAAALAWLVLGEAVGVREGVGAGVLLIGVALGLPRSSASDHSKTGTNQTCAGN
jgi:drug/metabolite transporter (DMT)-like permease